MIFNSKFFNQNSEKTIMICPARKEKYIDWILTLARFPKLFNKYKYNKGFYFHRNCLTCKTIKKHRLQIKYFFQR